MIDYYFLKVNFFELCSFVQVHLFIEIESLSQNKWQIECCEVPLEHDQSAFSSVHCVNPASESGGVVTATDCVVGDVVT